MPIKETTIRELAATPTKRPYFSMNEVGHVANTDIEPVPDTTPLSEISEAFRNNSLLSIVLLEDEKGISGMILRNKFQSFLGSSLYNRDLYIKKDRPAYELTERELTFIDSRQTLKQASSILMSREAEYLYDPFIIMHKGRYFGVGTVQAVLQGINNFHAREMMACHLSQQKLAELESATSTDSGFRFYSAIEQLSEVGGDMIHISSYTNEFHLACILDVAGKGLKAADFVNLTYAALKALDYFLLKKLSSKLAESKNRTKIINKVNKFVARNTIDELYATGIFLWLSDTTGEVFLYNYGHNEPFLIQSGNVEPVKNDTFGDNTLPFFGLDPQKKVKPCRIKLKTGDKLILFTDGITEAKNESSQEYSSERLQEFIQKIAKEPSDTLCNRILAEIDTFRQSRPKNDDRSILIVEYTNPTQDSSSRIQAT